MKKIWTVTIHEYLVNVKKLSFWLVTIGLPFLIVFLMLLLTTISFFVVRSNVRDEMADSLPMKMGIVDRTGMIDFEQLNNKDAIQPGELDPVIAELLESVRLPDGFRSLIETAYTQTGLFSLENRLIYFDYNSDEAAAEDLENKNLRAYLSISPDFSDTFESRLVLFNDEPVNRVSLSRLESYFQIKLFSQHYDMEQIKGLLSPFAQVTKEYLHPKEDVTKSGEKSNLQAEMTKIILPALFIFTMMMAVFSSTERLIRGLVEEKQNRVIEILLSSLTSNQLLAGKIFGLGMVGLTQLIIWLMLVLMPVLLLVTFLDWGFTTFVIFIMFFLGGYLLLAACIMAFGSLGNNYQQANQWSMFWYMLTLSPFFFIHTLIDNPEGTMATVLSTFPFTSPFAVISRYAAGAILWWEILLSLVVLGLSIFVAITLGAKLFRIGILMTGKTPSPWEVWKAIRAGL